MSEISKEELKKLLKKAFELGKSTGVYLLSNLPEKHAPLLFPDWYDSIIEDLANGEDISDNPALHISNVSNNEERVAVCLTCGKKPQSAGSEYCGECIDNGRY